MNILFVCTGNICRSPAAEYLLRAALETSGDPGAQGISVSSAGTSGMSGYGMDQRSLAYLRERGIDGSGFVARRLDRRILRTTDLAIGLEKSHVDRCMTIAPAMMRHSFRLHQLAGWHRSGELTTLDELPCHRRQLPKVEGDHDDPVQFSSDAAYNRVLDGIAADVRDLATLLTRG
ncbi:MAG: protein tyrosine phosphatase [Mycobacteriaceae bacterium]|uniref:arsenate reductase/protein-tyrosine-phosphatase family protein n=1 Tax=Corynebacterium sp. TaxID=1720 RepID=UPI003F985A3A